MAGTGRPEIGPRTYARLEKSVLAELDVWAAERGMKRAEAMRHLIATGLKISDSLRTLDSLGLQSAERIFRDADDDPEAIYQLLINEAGCSEHRAEIVDQVAPVDVSVMTARGYWFLLINHGQDLNERGNPTRWDHAFRVFETAEDAREAYTDAIVRLTKEYWSKDLKVDSLWIDFEEDVPLFVALAEAGRIPAAAIDLDSIRAHAAIEA